ncbi:hypothetical protein BJY21_002896 [Kineosphaera limosa]|uniref:Uncharacterized protein n=1 Tax=Kineosphaera limosa NBRC 100340 TaxID=1184609 RepID=K6VJT9_9MICO|nr:hypothetical protein [Kineosphaera limosa]NYE01712.1 hypothetical protein [Kineosphaera limosa]GAB96488.1 hypothetical protein KILIM_039_00630 [Kineosphaera limosa NBRC 100340]
MTDALDPQAQRAPYPLTGDPTRAVHTGDPAPAPDALNAALSDGSGGEAVSAQPFDIDPQDLLAARERRGWDEATNEAP